MMLEGEFYRDAGVAFGERSAVSLLQRDTGDWAGMQVFSCCSTGRSLTLVREVETNKYALGNAKCMSQYIWPTLCVCVTNANGTLCMSFSSCRGTVLNFLLSKDVTSYPRLLAAKQRKGFPNMVKHSGCSAWRGVSAACGASCLPTRGEWAVREIIPRTKRLVDLLRWG